MKAKKIFAGLLAAVVVMTGIAVVPTEADAAGSAVTLPTKVEYVANEDLAAEYQIDTTFGQTAPVKEGYFFGGWYADAEGVTPIKNEAQKDGATAVYAKFVPVQVLSVRAQNHSNTAHTDHADVTSTRFISSVDSYNYANVGFEVIDLSGETERVITKAPLDKVYSTVIVGKADTTDAKSLTPEAVFGDIENAVAQKFIVLNLTNIPESYWNSDIYVRPYWTTFDGVKVYGLAKYVYVEDGINGWISVPVNLHTGEQVTAGMVGVTFPSGLEYQECRVGRVFDEMTAAVSGNTVKCVGNVSDVTDVAADDIYAVFRFKVTGDYQVGSGTLLDFTVSDLGFANKAETLVNMDIMNVKY